MRLCSLRLWVNCGQGLSRSADSPARSLSKSSLARRGVSLQEEIRSSHPLSALHSALLPPCSGSWPEESRSLELPDENQPFPPPDSHPIQTQCEKSGLGPHPLAPSPAPSLPPSPGEGGPVRAVFAVGCAVRTMTVVEGAHSTPYPACLSPSPGEGGREGAGEGARG